MLRKFKYIRVKSVVVFSTVLLYTLLFVLYVSAQTLQEKIAPGVLYQEYKQEAVPRVIQVLKISRDASQIEIDVR